MAFSHVQSAMDDPEQHPELEVRFFTFSSIHPECVLTLIHAQDVIRSLRYNDIRSILSNLAVSTFGNKEVRFLCCLSCNVTA